MKLRTSLYRIHRSILWWQTEHRLFEILLNLFGSRIALGSKNGNGQIPPVEMAKLSIYLFDSQYIFFFNVNCVPDIIWTYCVDYVPYIFLSKMRPSKVRKTVKFFKNQYFPSHLFTLRTVNTQYYRYYTGMVKNLLFFSIFIEWIRK